MQIHNLLTSNRKGGEGIVKSGSAKLAEDRFTKKKVKSTGNVGGGDNILKEI